MNIQKNIIYSSILTVSNYFFPLITFPYVSRTLGVTNIGLCNYVDSIITYFCVFSALGVAIIGVREIARVSNNKRQLSNMFASILLINAFFTLLAVVALVACTIFLSDFRENRNLFYIGLIKIISSLFLVEWFYKGIEDFSYITKRTLCIKILYVVSIFVFVKTKNDYVVYFFLTVFQLFTNAIINIYHLKKHILLRRIRIKISPLLKPYMIMGLYTMLTSMYTTFNIALLGYISGPTEVGYFTTATKLFSIVLSLFTAFTGVMLPRMSSLFANHEDEKFLLLINKSMDVLFIFSIPIIPYFFIFSSEVIQLIGGSGFEGAIIPFRIIMPLIVVVGYEQILIIQVLMPMRKDKAIFVNSSIGAVVGLFLNILLIPSMGSVGTSIAYGFCELSVLCSALFFLYKYIHHKIPMQMFFKHIIYNLPVIPICLMITQIDVINYVGKLVSGGMCVLCYAYVNNYYFMKSQLFIQWVDNNKMKLWKKIRR